MQPCREMDGGESGRQGEKGKHWRGRPQQMRHRTCAEAQCWDRVALLACLSARQESVIGLKVQL